MLILLQEFERAGHPTARLLAGTSYSLAHLKNKHERLDWSAYTRILANARDFFTDEDFERIGGTFPRDPIGRSISIIARLLFSVRDFYLFLNRGAGSQLFSCLHGSGEQDLGPNRLLMRVALDPGYQVSREVFLMFKGGLGSVPQVLGFRRADIEMKLTDNGAEFDIRYPPGGGALAWLRRALTWPFAIKAAARELKDANETLQARYVELDAAKRVLALQAVQLETANTIGKRVHEEIETEKVMAAIVEALVDVAGFSSAALHVHARVGDEVIERNTVHGEPAPGVARIDLALERSGALLGELRVWPRPEHDPAERRALMEAVVPTVCIALDNAFAYNALADYRANLEHKVEERTRQLREAIENRDRIFANINHEIRTPLTLVLMAAQSIAQREGERLQVESRQEIEGVGESARKLLRLIDELLLIAAGQTRKLTLNRAPCDLVALVAQTVAIWQPAAVARSLKLSALLPERCVVSIDEIYFERVIGNLLSNAVKFTPPGGSIQVQLGERDGEARLEVRDTGIGIDDDLRGRLFGRFEQGRPAVNGNTSGSGLGLSLVRELVDAHGGQVGFDSPSAGGSIFWVTLAGARTRPFGANGHAPSLRLSPVDFGLQPEREKRQAIYESKVPARGVLLLAEDDPRLAAAMANVLADEHKVIVANDGLEALRLAELHHPDMLVSDVGMPGMDGLELARRFRGIPGNRLAPVLLVSARANIADRLAGFEAGAIDYIMKPFDPMELRARVRSQLTLRGLALKLNESEKLAALGTMAAGLAHEMRNPANAIVNALPPLREQLPAEINAPSSGTGQLLSVLSDASKQIAVLSRQLLGYKRAGELECESIALPDLLSRATAIMQPVLRGVTVRERLDYRGPIWCATPLMTQVLTNLLENAVHAAGPKGWIEIGSRLDEKLGVLEFSDSGPGVPPALRERIFEPFFTTKPVGQGTGLGLTTSREIARRHGGDLGVRPAPNGTLFRLEIPTAPSDRSKS